METNILTVKHYNECEQKYKGDLPNRFIEAFQPATFDVLGYPSRITHERQVYRYLDTMHDSRLKQYFFSKYDYQPTKIEFEQIKSLAGRIFEASLQYTGRGIVVKAGLVNALFDFCHIFAAAPSPHKTTVLELGGGAGVLACMLHEGGYRYIATDVAQGFYLTQSNLWSWLYPGKVHECVNDTDGLGEIAQSEMAHIPWWQLWHLRDSDLRADIIVSNDNLAEFHPRSLRFYLNWGHRLLQDSQIALFVAKTPGYLYQSSINQLLAAFRDSGYTLLNMAREFMVFHLGEGHEHVPLDYQKAFLNAEDKQKGYWLKPSIDSYVNIDDPLVARLAEAESRRALQPKVSFEELDGFLHSLDEAYDSPDEEFIHYCGIDYL